MRTKLLQTCALGVLFGLVNCSGEDNSAVVPGGTGGATSVTPTGGSTSAVGGNTANAAGGVSAASTNAMSTGGSTVAGGSSSVINSATGGAATGGAATGGAATGGTKATGGAATGGAATGGTKATGGAATGGAATGGTKATGGAATGGAATGGSSAVVNCSGTPLSGGTTYTSDGTGNVAGGYHYELWHDGGGAMKMTVYGAGAAFKADWNNAGDFLARVGLKMDETKTYDQYGTLSADYAYTKTGTGGGYSFIGIYGWTKNPLIEYYIVDDWFGSTPPTGGGALKGSFTVDGGTYNIYTYQRVNKPSIIGDTTFMQFFSVRQTARQCGHISITEHFKKWASLGLTMGKMYEAKLLVEAGGGVGTVTYTTATVTAK